MATIVGIVGEKGGGKETCGQLIEAYFPQKKVVHARFSDILSKTLEQWDIPRTRHNLQQLAIVMNGGFGLGTLTHAMEHLIKNTEADIVILDGVRWLSDAEMIRRFSQNLLIYVTADIKTRYARTIARKEKTGESSTPYEQFLKEENVQTELDIPKIGATANVRIDNDGSLEAFKKQVEAVCTEYF